MKLIAHRGNFNGINIERENSPEYISECIMFGYDAEIDIWLKDGELFLGHDFAKYKIDLKFLTKLKTVLWVHAKNIEVLPLLIANDLNCFWHNTDDCVLTSKNYIWTYPGKTLTHKSIIVMPDILPDEQAKEWMRHQEPAGLCSDNIYKYLSFFHD